MKWREVVVAVSGSCFAVVGMLLTSNLYQPPGYQVADVRPVALDLKGVCRPVCLILCES